MFVLTCVLILSKMSLNRRKCNFILSLKTQVSLYSAIMYFYNVFFIISPLPKSKIHLSIHPFCLTFREGEGGGEVCPSLAGQKKSAPLLCNRPHPPLPVGGRRKAPRPGCWFPVYFLWGHSAGWPRPSPSPHLVSFVFTLFLQCVIGKSKEFAYYMLFHN